MRHHRFAAVALAMTLAGTIAAGEPPPVPGMSTYRLGLLRRGPTWTATRTPATDSIQAGHMANINRMAQEGALLAAGPMGDRGDLRGIFIFRPDSVAALRERVARDPAVRSGRLVLDLLTWSAPSGIGEPYKRMAARPGHRDSMVRMQLVLLKTGPNATREATAASRELHLAHMGGILRGLASGELAAGGPIGDGGDLRGVLVYRGDSAFAHTRALEDPAVKAGHLSVEIHPWWVGYGTMPGDTVGAGK